MTASRRLSIGIDGSCWLNRRGFGRYARELVAALLTLDQPHHYTFFVDRDTARDAPDLPSSSRVTRVVVPTGTAAARAAAAHGRRSARDLWGMRQAVARHRQLDVFYFPAAYTYFPIRTRAKVVVTKHDMTDRRYPELLFPSARARFLWRVKIRLAMRRADLVVTVSETSRRDIASAFGMAPQDIRVVPDAVDDVFSPRSPGDDRAAALARCGLAPDDRFILYVGGISPHKNLSTLLRAYAVLAGQELPRPPLLVLVGDFESDVFLSSVREVREHLEALGLAALVRLPGFVADADLVHLYNSAVALTLPSLWEGFGLPALEAMACGTPVVASRAGALPEVVGDAGMLVDPRSPDDLAAALQRLLDDADLRDRCRRLGLARAREYRWDVSARALLTALEEVGRAR